MTAARPPAGMRIVADAHGLALRSADPALGTLRADFLGGRLGWRRRHGGGRGQALARAVGLRGGGDPPRVLDATAGLARDAFLLATLGCPVLALERVPLVHALAADAWSRARRDPEAHAALGGRLRLLRADAHAWLRDPEAVAAWAPDVVYLDPMHPPRRKSALTRKEMRWLAHLAGSDADQEQLLAAALASGAPRVVVKRPAHAPPLGGHPPASTVDGRTTRYDVLLPRVERAPRVS